MEFLLGAKVTSVGSDCVNYELGGKQLSAKADRVLISIGRRAMTQGIGLENIGFLPNAERLSPMITDRLMSPEYGRQAM